MMEVDHEYLQGLGVGLQGLRTSGQFCDAMVCVGSTRILVHKVVLSAASKTLHDLALDFDMMPHRDRDQLEIVIPPDIPLLAVNAFINFIYTGQLDLTSRIVAHMERLASLFDIQRLTNICQKFIQRSTTPDSQNLNLQTVNQTEADSSLNGSRPGRREHRLSSASELSRSNSACSGFSSDLGSSGVVNVKIEPAHLAAFETASDHAQHGMTATAGRVSALKKVPGQGSLSMLEKLMSPRVNLQKLPANITPDVVVMVSDEETEGVNNSSPHSGLQYTLAEKEAIAVEAKRYGTTHVSQSRNIPLPDILSWMTLFGLRNPVLQKKEGRGKQVNHEADLALVRWIVQQQEFHGCVDLDSMKQYALTVHQKTNPKFCASKTWLGNFLQRNLSVLQKTKFVHGDKTEMNLCAEAALPVGQSIKQELTDGEEHDQSELRNLSGGLILEQANLSELGMVNEALSGIGHFTNKADDDEDDNGNDFIDEDTSGLFGDNSGGLTSSYLMDETEEDLPATEGPRTQGSVVTPFGKRPIIVGQSKSFDMKSERRIVQWVLERNARDGYVFTDDFKDFAKTLYKGSKPFGATQCWMKKFLRRNRVLRDVKFCSKYKNTYTTGEKQTAVALAKRFGVTYASKRTGINQKIIHCWKLSADKGLLTLEGVDTDDLMPASISVSSEGPSTTLHDSMLDISQGNTLTSLETATSHGIRGEASHGIVPEFEDRIVEEIKELQLKEGSVNYNDISAISQSIYKETRPTFKASYGWIKSFLERRKIDLLGIELENVSKVFVEDETVASSSEISKEQVSAMVDQALKAIGTEDGGLTGTGEQIRKPIIVGPSVVFDRKTEKHLVDWALERFNKDGYVFTDDFKQYAKSVHKGPKHFSASSGWMTLFLRRHRALKDVQWKSKFKNNYTEGEKMAAVQEAKRLGTGHVGRTLGIDPALICAWRIKMEKNAPKHQTFWKGTKLKKFGWKVTKFRPLANAQASESSSEAFRGVVPEFEQRIIELIHEEHEREGSISYEEMSRLAQSVYKETRPSFKASYAWIRNFMKRNEGKLQELNIENVKKVFMPDDETDNPSTSFHHDPDGGDFQLTNVFHKRPIIVGQSRAFDMKTEKRLVQWLVDEQQKNGYVFLDQFKTFAQSLYKGEKKFAATQAWRIKFLRRNHAALKHVKFTSRFRNQYSLKEKKVIVQESKKFGVAHVAKMTGIEHCLINQWRLKLERSGLISADTDSSPMSVPSNSLHGLPSNSLQGFASKEKPLTKIQKRADPGLLSSRGIVPAMERRIMQMINNKMDDEGSVSYKFVSMAARSVYKETRPQFKASYNWVMDFVKRNKKALRHVDFETSPKAEFGTGDIDMEILCTDDTIPNMEALFAENQEVSKITSSHLKETTQSAANQEHTHTDSDSANDPMIVIENFEGEVLRSEDIDAVPGASSELNKIAQTKRPIIIGKAKHFTRKEEKQLVEWLMEKNEKDGFVFTDDFRRYARSMYKGEQEKFGATNAWITKFLRRNRLENKLKFQSKLVGNNPKFEEKIVQLILKQQEKEGSVSNDDIQRITMSVYKEIRPNFRACYNWIKDFIKRHKDELAGVELENVKKLYIPDDNEKDGVLIRDYDPSLSISLLDNYSESRHSLGEASNGRFVGKQSSDTSWVDLDDTVDLDSSQSSFTSPSTSQTSSSVLVKLANQKRPVIIAPPKMMDIKTEKKLVQWMQEQQEKQGCVYLDLFKQYAKSLHTGPKHFAATQAWMTRFKQRNHTALKNVVIKSRFRNEYSMEDKIAIVEEAKRLGSHHVGRKLGISGSVIYQWKAQLDQAEKPGGGAMFKEALDVGDAGSSRGVVPEFESRIVRMVLETQRAKGSVSDEDISLCSRSLYKETRPNFKASYNWVSDFIRKYEDQFKEVVFENRKKIKSEEEKLRILSEEKKYGTEHVIKKRNISASTISTWKKQMREKAIPIPKFKAAISDKIKKKYAKNKIKNYTTEEKRNMVTIAEEHGITHASLKLGISRKVIDKWIRFFRDQGEEITIKARKPSVLKKELEQKILSWVLEQNATLGVVLTNRVIDYARKVFEEAFTNFTASTSWLEAFLSAQGSKLENVRFRDKGDSDLEFSDEIKLKIARHAEVNTGTVTAELTGLLPKVIYHWRRQLKQKGYDLKTDLDSSSENTPGLPLDPSPSTSPEPTSVLQLKLDRIAAKFDIATRRRIVEEASINGTSATASHHKIPLPLLLKWMKTSVNGTESPATVSSSPVSSTGVPKDSSMSSAEKTFKRHSKETRVEAVAEAKVIGVKLASEKTGVPYSTLYMWVKEERESSVDSERDSLERLVAEKRRSVSQDGVSVASETVVKIIPPEKIKREPGLPVKTSAFIPAVASKHNPVISPPKKVVRKYTDQEKFDVVKSALKIGTKEAALMFDIPQSNVKRWRDLYKDQVLSLANVAAKKKTLPAPVIKAKHESQESVNESKRKAEESIEQGKPKRGKYTVEEKLAFVKESDTTNMKVVAEKAGVTLDCLYRWRFQYLASVRLAAATSAAGHSGTPDREKSGSPVMPAPRNISFMLPEQTREERAVQDIDEIDSFEHPENIVARLTEDELAQIESMTETTMKGLDDISNNGKALEGKDIQSMKSLKGASPPLDDIVISATGRLLEMTSEYEPSPMHGSLGPDETSPSHHGDTEIDEVQGDENNDWGKIKIVNVKSEAPIS
ncbi:uncharacterized protein LOC127845484 [Dreissena polymorpha]|uniref:Uncharacterized protein n=1 Tax=Dreissena polymorpha TaxID=45954 RepID=A0A9D4DXW3_DREPO|nr:uncharacterized protein LOC127845484 [Dreissena polymorpha]KAH3768835.1 hypothetical protein DPMN_170051 [Dreissena polymorpha]